MSQQSTLRVVLDRAGHVLLIGLNRPEKMNAFDLQMLQELSDALEHYESDRELRAAVLYAHGDHFTAGLDLAEVGPAVERGQPLFPVDQVDPLQVNGKKRTKPLILAIHGWCLTIGIELMLAADIIVAARDTRLGQIEIKRGIFPFGGATIRWFQRSGWGNAMRYLLTGEIFDGEEAYRIGLVQEVTEPGQQREVAVAIAQKIAAQAPLGVQATLASAQLARSEGPEQALTQLLPEARRLMETNDAAEGLQSFLERRAAVFSGD